MNRFKINLNDNEKIVEFMGLEYFHLIKSGWRITASWMRFDRVVIVILERSI